MKDINKCKKKNKHMRLLLAIECKCMSKTINIINKSVNNTILRARTINTIKVRITIIIHRIKIVTLIIIMIMVIQAIMINKITTLTTNNIQMHRSLKDQIHMILSITLDKVTPNNKIIMIKITITTMIIQLATLVMAMELLNRHHILK